MYCQKCGHKINSNDQYCAECGTKVSTSNIKKPTKNNIIIIIIVLIAIFLIVTRIISFIKIANQIINNQNQQSSSYYNNSKHHNNYYDNYYDDYDDHDDEYEDYYKNYYQENKEFNNITVDDYLKLKNENKINIIYIGRNSCRYCLQESLILKAIKEKYNLTINYLDISNITTKDYEKIKSSDEFFQSSWSIPLIILVKDNQIIEKLEGIKNIQQILEVFNNHNLLLEK